jgi:hypothetical protein
MPDLMPGYNLIRMPAADGESQSSGHSGARVARNRNFDGYNNNPWIPDAALRAGPE